MLGHANKKNHDKYVALWKCMFLPNIMHFHYINVVFIYDIKLIEFKRIITIRSVFYL